MRQSLARRRFVAGVNAAALAAAGAAVARAAANASERRRQLREGEIRELRSLWMTVAGCRMHARAANPARAASLPVVLVHGFGISSSYFVPAAERLATEFDVYAPDLPGHGRSDTPTEPLDVPALADALMAWMASAGLGRASLVANSMGCQVVVDAAVRYSERVDRLVLVGPTADPAGRTLAEHARRLALGGPYERASLNGLLLKDYARMGLRLVPEVRFMLRDRIEEKLPLVAAAVMLVRGEKDSIAPQRWVDEAARLARAEQVAVIPGWGHAVHYSAAREFVEAVAPFLRQRASAKEFAWPEQSRGCC